MAYGQQVKKSQELQLTEAGRWKKKPNSSHTGYQLAATSGCPNAARAQGLPGRRSPGLSATTAPTQKTDPGTILLSTSSWAGYAAKDAPHETLVYIPWNDPLSYLFGEARSPCPALSLESHQTAQPISRWNCKGKREGKENGGKKLPSPWAQTHHN